MPFGGKMYHVQTEDCALRTPVIRTFLYCKGEVLASKDVNYSRIAGMPDSSSRIEKLMVFQHRLMIRELLAGRHTKSHSGRGGLPSKGVILKDMRIKDGL